MTEPGPIRSKAPSLSELVDAVSRNDSDAPAARWVQRRLWRLGIWVGRTTAGTVATGIVSYALGWLSHGVAAAWHWVRL